MPNCNGNVTITDQHQVDVMVPGGYSGFIMLVSHAAYEQKVVITNLETNDRYVFKGSGEDVHMSDQNGNNSLNIPLDNMHPEQPHHIRFEFFYNIRVGGTDDHPAIRLKAPACISNDHLTSITLVSEDSTDNDDNDSYVTISYFDLPPSRA